MVKPRTLSSPLKTGGQRGTTSTVRYKFQDSVVGMATSFNCLYTLYTLTVITYQKKKKEKSAKVKKLIGKTYAQFFGVNFFFAQPVLNTATVVILSKLCVSIIKKALDNWLFVTSRRQKDRTKAKII